MGRLLVAGAHVMPLTLMIIVVVGRMTIMLPVCLQIIPRVPNNAYDDRVSVITFSASDYIVAFIATR